MFQPVRAGVAHWPPRTNERTNERRGLYPSRHRLSSRFQQRSGRQRGAHGPDRRETPALLPLVSGRSTCHRWPPPRRQRGAGLPPAGKVGTHAPRDCGPGGRGARVPVASRPGSPPRSPGRSRRVKSTRAARLRPAPWPQTRPPTSARAPAPAPSPAPASPARPDSRPAPPDRVSTPRSRTAAQPGPLAPRFPCPRAPTPPRGADAGAGPETKRAARPLRYLASGGPAAMAQQPGRRQEEPAVLPLAAAAGPPRGREGQSRRPRRVGRSPGLAALTVRPSGAGRGPVRPRGLPVGAGD